MILKRKIYSQLLDWKNTTHGTKALLIEGARRIGKSTIVEEFAKNEYKSYVIIDFNDVSSIVTQAFENYLNDLDTFFMILSTEYGKTLYPKESIIILDEIQRYPKARQAIKALVQDGRYDYIETGSLISIKENVKDITLPSEERHIKMFPLDFEEFCWALGESQLSDYIKQCYADRKPLLEGFHNKAMLLFKQYMIIGGMPLPIVTYLTNNRNFTMADNEKRDILTLYKSDINKAEITYRNKIAAIFSQVPSFLSHHEKKVIFSKLGTPQTSNQFDDAFFWLNDSMICNVCYNCTDPNVGLALNEDHSSIKCYMGDTGLLMSHTFTENEVANGDLYKQIFHDNLGINEGMLYENIIAQSLVANGYNLYFYTKYNPEKHRSDIEIDFIISNDSKIKPKIFPIEVKSNKRYSTLSLDKFLTKFSGRIGYGIVIHPKNLSIANNKLFIPCYMTFCL